MAQRRTTRTNATKFRGARVGAGTAFEPGANDTGNKSEGVNEPVSEEDSSSEDVTSAPVLIVPTVPAPLRLPPIDSNLFQRMIRNPRPDSPKARERECTEMLCSLLRNARATQQHLLRWMAELVGADPDLIDRLEFTFETEFRVGTKRIDLTVEGRKTGEAEGPPELIWTIEVKVGSGINRSGRIRVCTEVPGAKTDDLDEDLVSQIENYDHWLKGNAPRHYAGFMLAMRDLADHLPSSLKCRWRCLTWTALGLQLEELLRGTSLPVEEQFLCRHVAGFVRANLWRSSEMVDDELQLDFNDVALLRAYSMLGEHCQRRVHGLVASVIPIVEKCEIGVGPVTPRQIKNGPWIGSWLQRDLVRGNKDVPLLKVGIGAFEGEDFLSVWIDSPPKHPLKTKIIEAVRSRESKLHRLDEKWYIYDSADPDSPDVGLDVSLGHLLAAQDQLEAMATLVGTALKQLRVAGVIDAITDVLTKRKK